MVTDDDVPKRATRLRVIAAVAVLAVIWAVLVTGYAFTHQPPPPPPVMILDLPVQTVELPPAFLGTISLLTLRVNNNESWTDVPVTGVKCYVAGDPVTVVGHLTWQTIEPPGFLWTSADGISVRTAGCTTFNFKNPVPPDVRKRVNELSARGIPSSVWHIVGSETPSQNGVQGQPGQWQTNNFAIVFGEPVS